MFKMNEFKKSSTTYTKNPCGLFLFCAATNKFSLCNDVFYSLLLCLWVGLVSKSSKQKEISHGAKP